MAQKEKIHSFLEETVIEYPPYRFLITKVPSDASMNEYIQLLKEHNVSIVIRACEPTYSQERLEKAGIRVLVLI
jgi:protein tyrosine phosphatase type 4A